MVSHRTIKVDVPLDPEIADIVAKTKAAGGKAFDDATMRTFRTRFANSMGVYTDTGTGMRFFVTSEFVRTGISRLYVLRVAYPDGYVTQATKENRAAVVTYDRKMAERWMDSLRRGTENGMKILEPTRADFKAYGWQRIERQDAEQNVAK